MRNLSVIKTIGYAVFFLLLGFVFYLVYDSTYHNSEGQRHFSDREVSVLHIVFAGLAVCAGGYAIFLVTRAFYRAFTAPPPRKEDHREPKE